MLLKNGKIKRGIKFRVKKKQNQITWVKKIKRQGKEKKQDKQTTKGCSSGHNYHTNVLTAGIFSI